MSGTLNLHAGLLAVDGRGILVTGPARSGKSSLAVSLLRAAAREGLAAGLVADDRTVVERRGAQLFGSAPEPLAGLIELSGIGILRLASRAETAIDLAVMLADDAERLPEPDAIELHGLRVSRVTVPPRQAPFAADLVLTIITAGPQALLKT